ncbi:hypothetical protein [Bacillus sp. FJAT-52991]|uniref:IDEAL domain-containing protein n=1 Tax=Bacillus kandeliae TaxID=3129297 RepID=A0ABZ2NBC6_9BACI
MNKVDEEPTEYVELKVGDWVETSKGVGFIDVIGTVYVQVIICRTRYNFMVNEIIATNIKLESEDYGALANLALATGDKAWFMETTEKMKILVQ